MYDLDPRALTITAPNGTLTRYPTLAALMTAHAALTLASSQPARSDRKAQVREMKRQAGIK